MPINLRKAISYNQTNEICKTFPVMHWFICQSNYKLYLIIPKKALQSTKQKLLKGLLHKDFRLSWFTTHNLFRANFKFVLFTQWLFVHLFSQTIHPSFHLIIPSFIFITHAFLRFYLLLEANDHRCKALLDEFHRFVLCNLWKVLWWHKQTMIELAFVVNYDNWCY